LSITKANLPISVKNSLLSMILSYFFEVFVCQTIFIMINACCQK
jgi:hypothetical protein